MTQNSDGYERRRTAGRQNGNRPNRSAQKSGKRKLQRVKGLLMDFIHLELLVVVATIAFLTGKKVGADTAREELLASVQTSGSNQVYGAEGDIGLLGYVTNAETGNGAEKGEAGLGDAQVVAGKADAGGGAEAGAGQVGAAQTGAGRSDQERSQENDKRRLELLWKAYPQLILVNKEHKLPEDYEVELKKLPDGTNRADELAYDALTRMLKAGRKEGLAFEICSSYRSVERQQELLDEDINALMRKGYTYKEAYDEVTMETMPPGYSEHATGLAFDIVALDYQMLDEHQENTDENKWLRKHCAEYGFILRYPEDKEEITRISYESWHFRYVGEEAAAYIMEREITLEEYLEEYLEGELDILK